MFLFSIGPSQVFSPEAEGRGAFPHQVLFLPRGLNHWMWFSICCQSNVEKKPKEQEQLVHMRAGLGRRTAHLDESTTHEEVVTGN